MRPCSRWVSGCSGPWALADRRHSDLFDGRQSAQQYGRNTRVTFAMAKRGELPAWLARVHQRFDTPIASIVFFAAFVAALAISGSFVCGWRSSARSPG